MPAPTNPNTAPNISNPETNSAPSSIPPPPNMPPPPHHPPLDGNAHYPPPPSYRYPPPPSYYDPYYDMRYDPYYPPPPSHGPLPPPPLPPNAPPPRYSPEYRTNPHRYAYPPPPPRASPRSMGMNTAAHPSNPGPPANAAAAAPPPPSSYASSRPTAGPMPGLYRGPPPRLRNVRPSPIQTTREHAGAANAGGLANPNGGDGSHEGAAQQHTPTHVDKGSTTGTPIVSRGPSPDGSKGTVASNATGTVVHSTGGGGGAGEVEDEKERDADKTPDGKNQAEFMVNAVDNIIAAAEQIEKRDSPPNCPLESKASATPTSIAAPANNTNANNNNNANASNPPPPSVAVPPAMADPNSSPPPPSFHRYSTSPVVHHNPPPPMHSMPPPPPNHSMPPPPPPNHNFAHYDPYYDYGRPPYDYYDSHYYPPPPPPPHPYDKPYDHHPPHCNCNYCSPNKRRHPQYPPPQPYWDRDYQDYTLSLSSPETQSSSQPPTKKRRHNNDSTKRMYHTYSNATKHKSSTTRRLTPQEEEAETNRVIRLAAEVERDPNLYRAVLLHMALEKESPKKKPSFDVEEVLGGFAEPSGGGSMSGSPNSLDGFGGSSPHGFGAVERGVIGEGFYWKDYPLLENVLRKSMDEYYEMSENCPQSKQQQQFNNRLVSKVYHAAITHGYTFDPVAFAGGSTPLTERKKTKSKDHNLDYEPLPPGFNYKKLRDRIRCYYKTHVQNSKKRLTTMLKNPTKPKNREILLRVVAEVKSEGYVGPISNWDGPKSKKQKSKVTPSVTFSSDDDFGLGSFSADSNSPTEGGRVLVESTQVVASPFRRMEHAQILSSMRDGVSL